MERLNLIIHNSANTAPNRIFNLFSTLLEKQFPVEDHTQPIELRSPSEFASRLNIHVNHLNRTLKTIAQKTTSQLINERILREAKSLLRHTDWSVATISFVLGFSELTNFHTFFKKHTNWSPVRFRHSFSS
ncbi:AraC family transcriptional regulator [Pedobacter sp. BAL39]|uniref:helix-turn-helix domain-containing protein n=1 Tax=Pedobacter sp. BAL39 TaxID=391596 RepID=UPI00067FD1DB|nr:helix-turn-helix transcriptional regulator [Pedobacter sp. BAL39]